MQMSEDEFAWVDASDSNSSTSMSSIENESQNDYESETSKSYKKKLHKKLFNNASNQLQNEISKSDISKSSKKRKIKEEPPDNDGVNPKNRKIKVEPESDIDSNLKRKKEKHLSENGNVSETTLINFLNKKVKEEQDFIKPKPPKVKERLISSNCNLDESYNVEVACNSIETKKKKKHKNKKKDNESNNSICDDNAYRDTSNEQSLTKKQRHNSESNSNKIETNISEDNYDNHSELDQSHVNVNSDKIAKKSRKKITSISIDNETIDVVEPKKSKNRKKNDTDSCSENADSFLKITDNIEQNQKSPSKNNKRKDSDQSITNENHFTAVKSKKRKRKETENWLSNDKIDEIQNNSIASEKDDTVEISAILNTDNTVDDIVMEYDQSITNQDAQADSDISDTFIEKSSVNESEINITSIANKSILKKKNGSQKSSKLADSIRFEEETSEYLDSDFKNSNCNNLLNLHVNKFLKRNSNFKIINKKMPQGTIITENDEIWVLTVPNDVTINMFKDAKITIDNKCKIKINNESYVGHLDISCGKKCNILFQKTDKLSINSVNSNGTIQLHKRLPKPRIMNDNIVIDERSFIPLPETKCRHPIFGSEYKSAMKIPSEIKEKLKESATLNLDKKHRKKTKKYHKVESEDIIQVQEPIEIEVPEIKKKKKKKRKLSKDDMDHAPKKIKYEPDSVEAWESEKAIEENLFNF